jgi:ATP-dependent helicase/nuclease subunit A
VELTEHQRKAVEITDRNVIVSAGAGTGKTAVLVARFVHLVSSGLAEVSQILAITFTEKAAEEMKQRIAAEFQRLRMRKEKTAVETAYISTIHSFCARLIRENPFAAGVDPEFEVMDEMDRQMLLGELFEGLFSQGDEDFLELAEHYGDRAISGAIITYMDLCRSLGREIGYVEELLADPNTLTDRAEASADRRASNALRQIQAELDALSPLQATGSCEEKRQQIVSLKNKLTDVRSFRGAAEEIAEATSRMPIVPKKGGDRAACLEVRQRLAHIKSILKAEQAAIFFDREAEQELLPSKVALLKGVAVFWRNYEERKRREGVLDYEDLQLIARRLLRDDPALRREYRDRFPYVLVDEFQDINGLQKELIELLSSGRNLFVVGDTHQSIYGFRNADVEIFADLIEQCELSPKTHSHVFLRDNFRSGRNLISFFNVVFSTLWSNVEPEFRELRHAREHGKEPSAPSVEIFLSAPEPALSPPSERPPAAARDSGQQHPAEFSKESPEELRRREAVALAARIAGAVEHGEIEVYDPKTEGERPIAYGDMAVLCRSRASYQAYAEAFDALGIPYCTVGGQDFYEKQEVCDLINLLRVIDNPLRDIPLAAVLRSPFVGVRDDSLVLMRRHVKDELDSPWVMEALRGASSVSLISEEEREKLQQFLSLLDGLRKRKDSLHLHELVKAALGATPYRTRLLASPGGRQKAANVLKFLNILRQYDSREANGIAGFLRFYEGMRSYGPQEEEAPLEAFSADVVKLMTIHSAKGLEFPVVVVADMARPFNFDTGKILVSKEMEIGCDPWEESKDRSCGKRLVFDERKEKQLAEEQRLLYVAMTRARDHLILAGGYKPEREYDIETARFPLDWLLGVVGRCASLPEPPDSTEVLVGEARVRISVNPGVEAAGDSRAGRCLMEEYTERIAAGEKIPMPDKSSEVYHPQVKKVMERIAARPQAGCISLPAELSVSQLMLYEECPCKFLLHEMMGFPEREVMRELGLCPSAEFPIEREVRESPSERAVGPRGRRFGELVHGCLEQIDLRAEEPQDLPATVARFFSVAEEARAAEDLIRRFLRSEAAAHLRCAREIYRELRVQAVLDSVILTGIIDVCYPGDTSRWTILDFKTGTVPEEDSWQYRSYSFQMLVYAVLIAQAMGACPEKAVLYFLESGAFQLVQTGASEIEQTRKRIAHIIEAVARGEFPRGERLHCNECEYTVVCPSQDENHSVTGGKT